MKTVIEVRKGVVTAVIADGDLEVIVVDYDNIGAGDPGAEKLTFEDGSTAADLQLSGKEVY